MKSGDEIAAELRDGAHDYRATAGALRAMDVSNPLYAQMRDTQAETDDILADAFDLAAHLLKSTGDIDKHASELLTKLGFALLLILLLCACGMQPYACPRYSTDLPLRCEECHP